jgi:hypothetical protein
VRLRSRDLFQTVHTEGGLLPADLLQRIAEGDRTLDGLRPSDYHLDPGERINERITRAWTRLTSAWRAFDDARQKLPAGDAAGALTRDRWLQILFDELGYGRLVQMPAIQIEDKQYPIFSQWLNTPIHLVGAGVSVDQRTAGVRGAAGQSPHSLLQELLNRSSDRLWGMVSNGLILRVLRDNVSLTRQAYVQFDLEAMFSGEVYSDFALLWLICHESRVEAAKPEDCWLERWSRTAAETGTRALDALRQGVEEAIERLGVGFLAHQANKHLHEQLADGRLDPLDYYRTLLRLVYRLLFLFVAEDRDALLDPNADELAKDRYTAHYSTAHLRELASKRRGGRHHDRYEQLKLVMAALHEHGQPALALPALGSYLWDPVAIGPLTEAKLANEDLFVAVRSLATVEHENIRRGVDFRNLGAEELGSVYESLLELHPTINRDSRDFKLEAVAGSERKITGSYYTPSSLISALLDSALEPVLDEAAGAADPEAAILEVSVVDPASGSGHFLIAAANRIAKRLATIRTGDMEPSPEAVRAAVRDVVGRSIYAVDVNPMAVELCKVSLWMEALEPGRPLSFLDDRIVCGNSLLGATPELIAAGIPNEAFKPILGDDKKTVTELRKRNAQEQRGQMALDVASATADADVALVAQRAAEIARVDDHSLAGVRERQRRYEDLLLSPELQRARLGADVWCTAFVVPKRRGEPAITQDTLLRALRTGSLSHEESEAIDRAWDGYAFHHWHIAFPAVWERGGFDLVLGNPPWERVKLQEKEFFAARSPKIASAPNKAARDRLIKALADEDPALLEAFEAAKRESEGASHFIRSSGRYPLCGRGDVNTYAVFAELMRSAVGPIGRAGAVLPTGIATDDTTKHFFSDLIGTRSLVSLFGFENEEFIFPAVHHATRFCLLTLTGTSRPATGAQFTFFLRQVEALREPERKFILTPEDFALLNPNTRTCPIFRYSRDAELTKAIYRRVPVLVDKSRGADGDPWSVSFVAMFHMANDSGLFRTPEQLEGDGWRLDGNVFRHSSDVYVPLYEAKMVHHFDHRFGTYEGQTEAQAKQGKLPELSDDQHADPDLFSLPRYWVPDDEVDAVLAGRWDAQWLLGWRRISGTEKARTIIASVVPRVGVGDSWFLLLTAKSGVSQLVANLSTFVFDYAARQKMGGTNASYFIMEQLPLLGPDHSTAVVSQDWIRDRVLELTYTAWDMEPFAHDLGYNGPPFRWDADRRFLLRCELDAAFFHLYGLGRDDVEYVMDTFPIIRDRDIDAHGEYRTRRVILERFEALAAANAIGVPYESPLDPPPGDPRAAHRAPEPTAVS